MGLLSCQGPNREPVSMSDQINASMSADDAIPLLLDRYGGRIHALGLRLCRHADDAEDLLQETFLQAWRGWEGFEGRADPGTWLYRIAARVCARARRRRAGQPSRTLSLEELLPFGSGPVPDLAADDPGHPLDGELRRELVGEVEAAIADLPEQFRMPVVLKEVVGFSVAEVAEVLDLKPATVKTRLHRGRLMVRKAVADHLPTTTAPPPAFTKQVCLDLLHAKQDALDRGVEMPCPEADLCARCRAIFASMDLTQQLCRSLGDDPLDEGVRASVLDALPG